MSSLNHDDSGMVTDDDSVVYEISTYGADFDVDGLIKRFDRGDIYVPPFQRKFVWTHAQASRFIESILLGLPIPNVFLYREDDTRKLLIVDGRQRLTSLSAFRRGRLPESKSVFRLVEVKAPFQDKTYDDLRPEDKRRFDDAIIHAMIIQQLSPLDGNSAVYHIFDRLNSNGTPALPQEIRAAVYHGVFQDALEDINKGHDWRSIFGPINKRGKDQELILRFYALRAEYILYKKPMGNFLNNYMERNRNTAPDRRLFDETCSRITAALGPKPFRPKSALNVAIFDAFMVGVSLSPGKDSSTIRRVYTQALKDGDFIAFVERATSDESSVIGRIGYVIEKMNA